MINQHQDANNANSVPLFNVFFHPPFSFFFCSAFSLAAWIICSVVLPSAVKLLSLRGCGCGWGASAEADERFLESTGGAVSKYAGAVSE